LEGLVEALMEQAPIVLRLDPHCVSIACSMSASTMPCLRADHPIFMQRSYDLAALGFAGVSW
jgi:hypothetical protein